MNEWALSDPDIRGVSRINDVELDLDDFEEYIL